MRCAGVASMSFFFAMSLAMPTTRNSSGADPAVAEIERVVDAAEGGHVDVHPLHRLSVGL